MTTIQKRMNRCDRVNWRKAWSSWDGQFECLFVYVTKKYIYFARGYHPDAEPGPGYCLDRAEWERSKTHYEENGETTAERRAFMVWDATCISWRKCEEQIRARAVLIERGRRELLGVKA